MSSAMLGRCTHVFCNTRSSFRRRGGIALALLLAIALLAIARPSFAQNTSIPDASISDCTGCQSGTVELTLNGISRARAERLVLDTAQGRWLGAGTIDYEGNGISVHEHDANFSVRFEDVDPADVATCKSPIPAPKYAAHIEVRTVTGELVLVAGIPVVNTTAPCPTWRLTARVGHDLPKTLALLLSKYRDGNSTPQASDGRSSHVQVNGRWIRF